VDFLLDGWLAAIEVGRFVGCALSLCACLFSCRGFYTRASTLGRECYSAGCSEGARK